MIPVILQSIGLACIVCTGLIVAGCCLADRSRPCCDHHRDAEREIDAAYTRAAARAWQQRLEQDERIWLTRWEVTHRHAQQVQQAKGGDS
jgi:hypothetical protein